MRKKTTIQTLGDGTPLRPAPSIIHHSYKMTDQAVSVDLDAGVLGMLWETVYARYLTARGSTATAPIHQARYAMLVAALIAFEEAAGVHTASAKKAKPIDTPPVKKAAALRPVSKPRIIRKRGSS